MKVSFDVFNVPQFRGLIKKEYGNGYVWSIYRSLSALFCVLSSFDVLLKLSPGFQMEDHVGDGYMQSCGRSFCR